MHGSMGDLFHMFGEVEVDLIANFQTGIALGIQILSLMLYIYIGKLVMGLQQFMLCF
jgi:hypothetical protein